MLGSRVHLKMTSDLLGHATIGITADLYTHMSPRDCTKGMPLPSLIRCYGGGDALARPWRMLLRSREVEFGGGMDNVFNCRAGIHREAAPNP
jgi:hypothetical protein